MSRGLSGGKVRKIVKREVAKKVSGVKRVEKVNDRCRTCFPNRA